MNEEYIWFFSPPRRRGLLINGLLLLFLSAWIGVTLAQVLGQPPGATWLVWLFILVLGIVAWVLVAYRLFALWRAAYILERDGVRLRWGLRAEDLPLEAIEWIRPADELGFPLPLPPFTWPGAILGGRTVPELGMVEFLASERDRLLLVATPQRIYAISPEDPRAFLRSFRRVLELGSLSPFAPFSAQPAALLQRVWENTPARWFLLIGLALSLALLTLVSLIIPSRNEVALGYTPQGQPLPPVPSQRLMLLPILALMAYIGDLLVGMYFFRREDGQALAYLLWAVGALTPLLLIVAVFYTR